MPTEHQLVERAPPLELREKRIVLLLQGGGALGSYHVGAARFQKRAPAQVRRSPVGGISIGAVNAAVIAGPRRGNAVAKLERL